VLDFRFILAAPLRFFFEKKINSVQIFTIKELNSLESRKKTFLSDLKIEKERKNPTDKQTEKNTKKKIFHNML